MTKKSMVYVITNLLVVKTLGYVKLLFVMSIAVVFHEQLPILTTIPGVVTYIHTHIHRESPNNIYTC